jgi:hypothetical protein
MSGATFGRKGAGPDPDLAARRAAFLAAERARPRMAPADGGRGQGIEDGFTRTAEPRYVPRKTNGTAYLLWFFLGGVSAHRFYLGYRITGIFQMMLTPLGYAMMMTKSPGGMIAVPAACLWILLDAILIPSMVTSANERARELSLATTFA